MENLNVSIFRQYDIRGKADSDLTSDVVTHLGRAVGTWIQQKGILELAVGADNRLSSPRLKQALIDGLMETGCRVLDLGTVVTPMLYYAPVFYNLGAGIMVTGSHNPPDENGFKIALGQGTIYGDDIQELRFLMESEQYLSGKGSVASADISSPYFAMLMEKINLGRRLKVAVDCGNGTASLFAREIMANWNCEVLSLFCESDPTFPNHHPDPVKSENLEILKNEVLKQKCDLGIAYDGDADRLGVVDDKGEIIWGDTLMALYWREILERQPGSAAIVEVKCSQALIDEIQRMGGNPLMYKTGHSLIKAKMKELHAPFTGEMSGHMFFADEYFGFDDAFYASGRLLRILSETCRPLSELVAEVPKYYSTAETRVPCGDEVKFEIVDRMVAHFRNIFPIIDVDGARVLFDGGWGLVRASNTQPVLVARCEAKTPEQLESICHQMHETLVKVGGVKPFRWDY
ncbi:MAG: phosphomannomutase/phosphoglucomutase [Candidatus Saccharibacteria bacterium]